MSDLTLLFARSAGVLAAAMVLLWLVSLVRRDASIADPFWGTGFALVAWTGFLSGGGVGPRRLLVVALTSLWGLRLSIHLLIRNLGHGEDPRYQAMRKRAGPRFAVTSLFTVFLLQGALLWVVSLPLQAALAAPGPSALTPLDFAGSALWAVGLFFEAVGDLQLGRFRADPASPGRVLDTGLWRYTRHPNYFGDALLWWGFGCIALATGAWWALSGPALMTFLLLRVSGVTLLERGMVKRRPDYQAYVDATSAFIPWFPRRRR
jgi:steroid 5-alpha reductase family enzyme